MKEPNWIINILIGSIIGYLVPYFPLVVNCIFRIFKKSHFTGDYFSYHYSFKNNIAELHKSIWKIKKGFLHQYIVKVKSRSNEFLKYSGSINISNNQIVINFESKSSYKENSVCRLINPIPNNDSIILGFWLSQDFDSKISAGPQILSREELTDVKINDLLNKRYQCEDTKIIARVIS